MHISIPASQSLCFCGVLKNLYFERMAINIDNTVLYSFVATHDIFHFTLPDFQTLSDLCSIITHLSVIDVTH
jgi:hypothetical protein